jgi:large subunit ribosomal protein L17
MRHGKKNNHLGRTSTHRKALLSNMATSLIINKRISTTVAKAKELRKYVEPLLTKSKTDSTHSRRVVFSYLQNKDSMKVLFSEVAEKIASRPGGYTRILKTGTRLGDNSDMCIIELVDFNDTYGKEGKSAGKAKTRRSRGGAKAQGATDAEVIETKDSSTEVKAKAKKDESAKSDEKKTTKGKGSKEKE